MLIERKQGQFNFSKKLFMTDVDSNKFDKFKTKACDKTQSMTKANCDKPQIGPKLKFTKCTIKSYL